MARCRPWRGPATAATPSPGSICSGWTPPARASLLGYLASLPLDVQARWHGPKRLVATMLTADLIQHPYPRQHVIGRAQVEATAADRAKVWLPGAKRERTAFVQTPDGWKLLVDDNLLNGLTVPDAERAGVRP